MIEVYKSLNKPTEKCVHTEKCEKQETWKTLGYISHFYFSLWSKTKDEATLTLLPYLIIGSKFNADVMWGTGDIWPETFFKSVQ